jgi:ankyrin repeat protein
MPIFEASSNGYTETLSKLINNGANINIVNDKGMTPLHIAIKNGHTATVKVLIAAGANISAAAAINGWTPLYIACAKGYTPIVNALIEAGADVNVPMGAGITPLSIAIMKSHTDIITALMNAGADLNRRTYKNIRTPIEVAEIIGTVKEMKQANNRVIAEIYRRQNEILTSTPKEIFLRKYRVNKSEIKDSLPSIETVSSSSNDDLLPGETIHS